MPRYVIRHIPAGDRPIADVPYTGTKAGAMQAARRIAEAQYPGMTIRRGGGDAIVVFDGDTYRATVGVEPGEAWQGAEPEGE